MVSMFPCISFAGGHLENGSITGNRGISRNVSSWNRILRKKICKIGDFHKKSIKTLAPNEFPRSALVYTPLINLGLSYQNIQGKSVQIL